MSRKLTDEEVELASKLRFGIIDLIIGQDAFIVINVLIHILLSNFKGNKEEFMSHMSNVWDRFKKAQND